MILELALPHTLWIQQFVILWLDLDYLRPTKKTQWKWSISIFTFAANPWTSSPSSALSLLIPLAGLLPRPTAKAFWVEILNPATGPVMPKNKLSILNINHYSPFAGTAFADESNTTGRIRCLAPLTAWSDMTADRHYPRVIFTLWMYTISSGQACCCIVPARESKGPQAFTANLEDVCFDEFRWGHIFKQTSVPAHNQSLMVMAAQRKVATPR